MSYIKTSTEIQHIRESCRIANEVMDKLLKTVRPGITTGAIDELADKLAKESGVKPSFKDYLNYPASTCISVNEQIVHGLPGKKVLKEGDVVGIDFGINYRGYFSDMARTIPVGKISPATEKLLQVTKKALQKGIEQIKPGNRISDIGAAVQKEGDENNYGIVRELVGHGVGTAVHEPPAVPNYYKKGDSPQMVPGMVLAVEPMFNAGKQDIKLQDDGWTYVTKDGSVSAHFEDTILVTEKGHEVLTRT